MSSFCSLDSLITESDVEQKFIWLLLTLDPPLGLGFSASEIITKRDIRKFEIGKGKDRKVYFPDYVISMGGLPMFIVEAKAPNEELPSAVREARLYATELNARFSPSINPCAFTIVSNGGETCIQSWDSDTPLFRFTLDEANPANVQFSRFIDALEHKKIQAQSHATLRKLVNKKYFRPVDFVGGKSVRNEEIAPNTFGASLVLNYRSIFNPSNRAERAFIVRNAYIPSQRRERYIHEIDRIIRAAAPISVSDAKAIEDTGKPDEVTAKLYDIKLLEHQVLLLVGAVGAGKSTFIDYLQEITLPPEIKQTTEWLHLDLNVAPLNKEGIYDWVMDRMRSELLMAHADLNLESISGLKKLYGPELQKLKHGVLSLFQEGSDEYNKRLADEITALQRDRLSTARALERHLCAERGKLLIIVCDNCDKRDRDEQLLMFQVAQWIQTTFRCLVVLPLRDVTYDNHRHEPPLDTALKDLVFRIEPPNFQKVLQKRVLLALQEMQKREPTKLLSFSLKNGLVVQYPSSKLGMFLASIMKSVYEHEAFIRRMISGIAGRDIRRAMEIFLQFCTSGYIDEAEILKIMTSEGQHVLPYYVVSRVLFRMNRRFYDGNASYLKNVFQCSPEDPNPEHFVRVGILDWLWSKRFERGPNGIRGFHRTETLLQDLALRGFDSERVLEEVHYLITGYCIAPEHQRFDRLSPNDLICISPAGYIHLDLVKDLNYLAACAEDLWFVDESIARAVSTRISKRGSLGHFRRTTSLYNARDLVDYLLDRMRNRLPDTLLFLTDEATLPGFGLTDVQQSIKQAIRGLSPPNRPTQ